MGKVAGKARKQIVRKQTAKPNRGHELDTLLKHPQLWRADQLGRRLRRPENRIHQPRYRPARNRLAENRP